MHFPRIRELRIESDKTQKEIADFLNCNRLVYARYENGIREIPVSMLIELAKFFEVRTDYILGLEE